MCAMPRERWRLRDLLLLAAMLYPTAGAWWYFVYLGQSSWARWAYLGSKVLQALLPVVWVAAFGGGWQRLRGLRRVPRGWIAGTVSGLAVGAALVFVYLTWIEGSALAAEASRRIAAKLETFALDTRGRYVLQAAALSVGHSLYEEYYWRWFVYGRLASRMTPPRAAVVGSLAFASHHVLVVAAYLPAEAFWSLGLAAVAAVAAGGLLWCRLYERSGALLSPWLSHLLVDAALMVIGYRLIFG